MIDGKPVVKSEVKQVLDTDRSPYDSIYGADNAYWMLQDISMQQKWIQKSSPAEEQLKEWSRKYVVYNGQYEVNFPLDSKEATIDRKTTKLWSEVLPKLLLASNEEEFDRLFEDYLSRRTEMGYDSLMEFFLHG